LKIEYSSKEKTSIDLAGYKTLSNVFKPIAVLVAGILADRLGFNSVFFFSSLLILFSALTSLALPKSTGEEAPVMVSSYGSEVAALKK